MPEELCVALADDASLFRAGLAMLLREAGASVVLEAATGSELVSQMSGGTSGANVLVIDLRLPPTYADEGIATAVEIHRCHPEVGILVLSTYAEPAYAEQLLTLIPTGVGYLLKDRVADLEALMDALWRVRRGEIVVDPELVRRLLVRRRHNSVIEPLSGRERAVLGLMAMGRSNAGIAGELHVSIKTVERHIAAILMRLDLAEDSTSNRRVLAVLTWLRTGLAGKDSL